MCDDIGIVADEPEDGVRHKHEVSNAIVAVYVTSHPFCISCKAKIDPLDDSIGKCTNCPMVTRLDVCPTKLSAKLTIAGKGKFHTLYANLPMLKRILNDDYLSDTCDDDDLFPLKQKLLDAPLHTPAPTSSIQFWGNRKYRSIGHRCHYLDK